MRALVLEKKRKLSLRQINIKEELRPQDVRIKIHTVGIKAFEYAANPRPGSIKVQIVLEN